MSNFILIFIYLLFGYIFSKTKFFNPYIPKYLNKFVIYFSLPAMILLQIPKLSISTNGMIPVIVAWSVMAISAILVFLVSRYLSFSKELTGALLLVTPLGNTSFLGIPIISSYFGEDALAYVIIYDQLGTFLALAIYGTFILSIYSSTTKLNLKILLQKLFTFPPFVFLLIAFMLKDISFTDTLESMLKILAATIVPFALLAVGMQLKLKLEKEDIKPFSVSLFIKLIISPIAAIIICKIFGWDSKVAAVSIMEAGMAPMITAGAMASMAGLAPRLSSSILGYGIVISFISTFILFQLL